MNPTHNPLTSAITSEVPLRKAPLVRVIAQVRFPEVLSIEKRDFVAPFQEVVRSDYPVLRPERTQGVVPGPDDTLRMIPHLTWRFNDLDGGWKVSLAPDFLAIEATKYTSRDDFFTRFEVLMHALAEHVGPKVLDRVGVRYIDRISGDALEQIEKLVRPELLGVMGSSMAQEVVFSLSDSLFIAPIEEAQLHARWGRIPAGHTVDPAPIEAQEEPCWVLDLDMFRSQSTSFDPDDTVAEARSFAERIYTFFRWAVTDQFLEQYGGKT